MRGLLAENRPETSHAHHPAAARRGKLFPSWGFGFIGMRRFSDNTQGRWREGAGATTWRGRTRRPRAELSGASVSGPATALSRPRLRAIFPATKGWLRGPAGRRGAGLGREAVRCSSAALPPGLARRKLGGRGAKALAREAVVPAAGLRLCVCVGGERGVSDRPARGSGESRASARAGGLRLQPPFLRPFLSGENKWQPSRDWQH